MAQKQGSRSVLGALKPGVDAITFSGGLAPSSLLTMLCTWSVFSHVVVELSDGRILDATLTGGVSIHKPAPVVWRWERRVDLAGIFTAKELDAALVAITSELGKPYDTDWALGYLFKKRNWQDAAAWVCSELVWLGFPKLRNKPQSRVTPKNVWHSLKRLKMA